MLIAFANKMSSTQKPHGEDGCEQGKNMPKLIKGRLGDMAIMPLTGLGNSSSSLEIFPQLGEFRQEVWSLGGGCRSDRGKR